MKRVLAAAIVFVALLGPELLDAQQTSSAPVSDNVLHACYVPATGTVYRIKEPGLPQACQGPKDGPNQHVEFSWNHIGPAGPMGPQGPKGDPGPQGPAGQGTVTGYEIVSKEITIPTNGLKTRDVLYCPAGKRPISGAAEHQWPDLVISESYPLSYNVQAWVLAVLRTSPQSWPGVVSVRLAIVCVNAS